MQRYVGAATILLLLGMVLGRAIIMRGHRIKAIHFGEIDRKDFLIPPFALLYFYLVFAPAFGFPMISRRQFFAQGAAGWVGVGACAVGLLFLLLGLVAFGKSFRVGIDAERPDQLVTTGVFAISRNPIYVSFAFVLLGEFLIFSNWILLACLAAGIWLFHRQVLREEDFLKNHYGAEYAEYAHRVRRYL